MLVAHLASGLVDFVRQIIEIVGVAGDEGHAPALLSQETTVRCLSEVRMSFGAYTHAVAAPVPMPWS